MNAKEYLRRVRQIHTEMLSLQKTIDTLHGLYGITGGGGAEPVDGTKDNHPVEAAVLRVIGVEEQQQEKLRELSDMLETAILLVDSLPDPGNRKIMMLYYINACTWDQISEILNCDRSTVYRAILVSLAELDELDFFAEESL